MTARHCAHYCVCAPPGPCLHALGSLGHGHTEALCCLPLAKCGLGACLSCTKQREAIAVVTGANRTLGFEVARILAQRGHTVVLLCRNRERGVAAAEQIHRATGNHNVLLRVADLSDLASIERFASAFHPDSGDLDLVSMLVRVHAREQRWPDRIRRGSD